MPIHDQGYRRYAGRRELPGRSWLVITKAGIQSMIRRRMFLLLLLASWVPFVVRSVLIYASVNFPNLTVLATSASTFRRFLDQQAIFVFFVTIYVGAGLVANDRRANALQIYLSKPLTRAEYVAGKLGVLMAFLLLVTWVPAMLLVVVQILFAGSLAFVVSHLSLFPAITVLSLVEVVLASFTMLALSSLSKSSRFVAIMYAGVIFFTDAIYGVLLLSTGRSTWSWVSVTANLAQVGDAIFRVPLRYGTPVAGSLAVIVGLVALSVVILERRVRGVEVVT